jgi:DNA-binding MarR family transcriptional regulator
MAGNNETRPPHLSDAGKDVAMGHVTVRVLANDFLGSAQVFSTALLDAVERTLLRKIVSGGLSHSQLALLKLVANTETHSIGDVATFLRVSNAAASKAVDKLVRRNLLARAVAPSDRREAALSLTPRSRRLLAAFDAARDVRLSRVFRAVSADDLRRASEVLDHLSVEMLDHRSRPDEVCLHCGVYYRENCPVRKLLGRRCFYALHRVRRADRGKAGTTARGRAASRGARLRGERRALHVPGRAGKNS